MQLSKLERLMLSNQYKILEALYPDDADYYKQHRDAIESGYELHYSWIAEHIYDGTESMSIEECREVFAILELFSTLKRSFSALEDKNGIEEWRVKFMGFDGNNETKQMGYTRYLVDDLRRYGDLNRGDDFNSHCPSIDRYRAMVDRWNSLGKPHSLSKEHILEIIGVGR